jgi:ketosteroid isomerase-like protein
MKHLFTITLLLLAVYGRAFADPATDQRDLTQIVKDLNAALVKVDIAFLERLLHKDYTHYRPRGIVENRAQYLKNRKTGRVEFESLVIDDVKVRRYGDTAVVTYRSTAKGKDQGGTIDEQRRWTRVFVWQEGRWQLVHSQGTTIQKPEPTSVRKTKGGRVVGSQPWPSSPLQLTRLACPLFEQDRHSFPLSLR